MKVAFGVLVASLAIDCGAADWSRTSWQDGFGEKREITAELITPDSPSLRFGCNPDKRKPWFFMQIDLTGESRRVANTLGLGRDISFRFSFDGDKPKLDDFYLTGEGTQFLTYNAVGFTGAYSAERWARAVLNHNELKIEIQLRGEDRFSSFNLTGDKSPLLEVMGECQKKTFGKTISGRKIAER